MEQENFRPEFEQSLTPDKDNNGNEDVESLYARAMEIGSSPEYQEAMENNVGCVEISLKHILSELRPELGWDYSMVKAITGQEEGKAGTAPFKLLSELPKYGIEAIYYTSIDPQELQQAGLDHLVAVFGENSRQEFAKNYNIEQTQEDILGVDESHILHEQLTLDDLQEMLEKNSKLITFVDASKQFAKFVEAGLAESAEHNPDALLLHAVEIKGIDEKGVAIQDYAGLFPESLSSEEFLQIWTVGPTATRETLVLNKK